MIRCNICGTENDLDALICEGCGAKLQENKNENSGNPDNIPDENIKQNENDKLESADDKNKPVSGGKRKAKKEIKSVHLIYLFFVLAIIGGVIIYTSGLFDEPEAVQLNQTGTDDFHRGADLNKLQEINSLRERVQANPDDHQAMLNLAHLLNDSGFYQEAVNWYNQYLDVHPQDADVYVDRGVCYYEMNRFDQAIESMEKGIEINPNHQIAHFNMGIVHLAMNNIEEAINWWQKAVDIDPNSSIADKSRELIQKNTNN